MWGLQQVARQAQVYITRNSRRTNFSVGDLKRIEQSTYLVNRGKFHSKEIQFCLFTLYTVIIVIHSFDKN